MLVAGIDVGSLTAKAVVMDGNKIAAKAVTRVTPRPAESAEKVLALALEGSGIGRADIGLFVGTGYGRKQVPFVTQTASEIACHAKGIHFLLPEVRAIIDIGGQDAKAARLDENGNVVRYAYNDKCASGTGRFLEVMAETLEVDYTSFGDLALASESEIRISNQCVVFAETEVVSLVNRGVPIGAIVKGLHNALASRVSALAKSIGVTGPAAFTGGVAKNRGVAAALSAALGMPLLTLSEDPQIMGAVGAALYGLESSRKAA